jgi:hypothetical protein
LWTANLISNIGGSMQAVDAWLFGPIWMALVFDNRPDHKTAIGGCGRGTDFEDKRRVS